MTQPTAEGDPRRRTIDETAIVELLLIRGWAFEVRAGKRAMAEQAARASLAESVAQGLPFRWAETGARLFDPAEVANFLDVTARRRGEPAWDRHVATARRLIGEAHAAAGGAVAPPPAAVLGPQRYAVNLQRTFNLESRRPGERIRLRLPLPLEDPALSDVETTLHRPADAEAQLLVAPGRLDVAIRVPMDATVTIGATITFTARPWSPSPSAAAPEPADAELYTKPSEGLIKVSDRIRALASKLVGGETDPLSAMRRFWGFISDELACGTVHYDDLPPQSPLDRVLERGWYDCKLGSALLAALCRARGIPARLVTGYMLHATAPGFHTWLEMWTPGAGWTPFDLWCVGLAGDGADGGWRDCYFGALDHRMTVERPPRLFSGIGTLRMPRAWHMLPALTQTGTAVAFHALDSGALVYREQIEVVRLG